MNQYHSIIKYIARFPRLIKSCIVLMLDINVCWLTVWLAFYLRLGESIPIYSKILLWPTLVSLCLMLPIFLMLGLYKSIFRYNGLLAISSIVNAIVVYTCFYSSIYTIYGIDGVPRSVGIIQPMLLVIFIIGTRVIARVILTEVIHDKIKKTLPRFALIYGAGNAGCQLASAIRNNSEIQIVGYLDDDCRLHKHFLNGLPIYNPVNLASIIDKTGVSLILLALPSITRARRNEIFELLTSYNLLVRTMPGVGDLALGKINIADVRDLQIDDLLGREPIAPDVDLMSQNIAGKVVVVTGGGGSIGGELCRQILNLKPAKLILVEQSEFALYTIYNELEIKAATIKTVLVPILTSVHDTSSIENIFSKWKPDTVYHAAAYKHVPLVEHNIIAGIKNNVFGTLNIAMIASRFHVSNFVLVSTDKAVRPTNVMGASKRLAENVLQALNINNFNINYSIVRFGNVLGSSGSVVPKFTEQIRNERCITVTDPEVTRFFMTTKEAAQLVIQAGGMAKGGEVFVLDMGEPIKILDLAKKMVSLTGLTLRDEKNDHGDIDIKIIGLRPGEKLYEELLIGNNPMPTSHPRIFKSHEKFIPWQELERKLDQLGIALSETDVITVMSIMIDLVPEYRPNSKIVDWTLMNTLGTYD